VERRSRRAATLIVSTALAMAFAGLLGCAPEAAKGPSTTARLDTVTTVTDIHGLDAVPPGFALVVLGESKEGSVVHHVRSLIIPELGIFQMELDGTVVAPAEMVLTVRTQEKQAGYRAQAVLEGEPRPMDMAFLDSPLTYPSDEWIVETSARTGNHISASLTRGRGTVVEERTVEADVDPQTGIITSEKQTRQYMSCTITRHLVPLSSQMTPDLAYVRARARTDWRKTIATAVSLGYPVLGLDLPTLQLHMLQFHEATVWLNYSAKDQPGRLAVRTWQLPSSEAKASPAGYTASWTAASSDNGESGMLRTFFEGDRAVVVSVYGWVVKEHPGILESIEGALRPFSETDQALAVEPPVLLFDEPMPLPSGANFGGLLSDAYRKSSG